MKGNLKKGNDKKFYILKHDKNIEEINKNPLLISFDLEGKELNKINGILGDKGLDEVVNKVMAINSTDVMYWGL